MRSSFTCVTQLGLGKDYKNLGVGSGKLDGRKEANRRWEERSRARNAVSFMYKYLHLSSKKEVRSAVIGPLRRVLLSHRSSLFFQAPPRYFERILFDVRLGRSFLETLKTFCSFCQILEHQDLIPVFLFGLRIFEKSLYNGGRAQNTVKATSIRQNVTTTSRVLDLTPRRRLEQFHDAETWRSSRQPTRTRSLQRPGPHCSSFADTGHRSATIPVIVVVVDVVVVVGTVVVAFNNGCNGCLDVAFATVDSLCTFVSSRVVWRSQIYSITLWITSSFDNFRFLGMSGTRDLNFVK